MVFFSEGREGRLNFWNHLLHQTKCYKLQHYAKVANYIKLLLFCCDTININCIDETCWNLSVIAITYYVYYNLLYNYTIIHYDILKTYRLILSYL